MQITAEMDLARTTMRAITSRAGVPHDITNDVVDLVEAMTRTLDMSDTQRGWLALAMAHVTGLFGASIDAMLEGSDKEIARQLMVELTLLFANVGERLITNDELPSFDLDLTVEPTPRDES